MSESRTKPICGDCGGSNVRADAYASWDVNAQEWVLLQTFDKGHICDDCNGDECSIDWIDTDEKGQPKQ